MSGTIAIALLAVMAGRPVVPPRQPRLLTTPLPHVPNFTVTATPATINFNATNPGTLPVVPGNATANLSWTVHGGNKWTVYLNAASSSFTNCPQIPVSAVTVACASTNTGGTASCAAPFPLSATQTVLVTGSQGGDTYSVNINFSLADSWRYIAETNPACSISITYLVDFPQ